MARDLDKVRFLKALAFEIRRKKPAAEALADCIEIEGRGGRHRLFRLASTVLASDGFVAALRAADLVGPEAAVLLEMVFAENDHRLLAGAINGLADYQDEAA